MVNSNYGKLSCSLTPLHVDAVKESVLVKIHKVSRSLIGSLGQIVGRPVGREWYVQYYRLSQKCISSGNFQLKFHQKCLLCTQENTHYKFAMEADSIFRYCLFPVWDSAYIQWNVVRNLQQFFQAVGCLSFVTFLLSKLSPNLWNRNRKELQLTPKICNSPPGGAHFTHWWPWSFYTLV